MYHMTSGSPLKILIRFSLPMLLSMVFQQLYNVVDSIIAGQCINVNALAAIGASYPVTTLFLSIATGASAGCSIVIAQFFGARMMVKVKTSIYTAMTALTILSVLLTIAGLLSCGGLLSLIHTPASIFDDAASYLKIYILGLLFLFLYNAANAIYNGLGDSKTPLYFLIFSSVFNVALDLIFVNIFHMGVAGLAWATLTAQGLAAALSVFLLIFRIRRIRLPHHHTAPVWNWRLLLSMTRIAIPSICQQSFISVGIFMIQGVVNACGSAAVAAFSAALKISTFMIMVMNTLPNALSSYASQNIGAGRLTRVSQGMRAALGLSEAIVLFLNLIVFIFGKNILSLFVSADNKEVIRLGIKYLYTVAPFYTLVGVKNCCDSILRGGGAMKPFMIGTFTDLLIRVGFAYGAFGLLGFGSICWAYPAGWVIGAPLCFFFYRKGYWKNHMLFKTQHS